MELLAELVDGFQPLFIFGKDYILDISLCIPCIFSVLNRTVVSFSTTNISLVSHSSRHLPGQSSMETVTCSIEKLERGVKCVQS